MRRFLRFLKLPLRQQRLIVESLTLLWLIRLMLWVLPNRRWRHLIFHLVQVKPRSVPPARNEVTDVAKAIAQTSRYVNDATCLVRALTCQIMLAQRGFPSELKIGVAFNAQKSLEGHAWVLFDNAVIIGYLRDLDRYSIIPITDFTFIRP